MTEQKKVLGIELAKATLGCFATIMAAVIGGVFLLVTSERTARLTPVPPPSPTPQAEATATAVDFCNGEQTWLRRAYFPAEEIRKCWSRDHYITGVAFNGGRWILVMSKDVNFTNQTYLRSATWPKDD